MIFLVNYRYSVKGPRNGCGIPVYMRSRGWYINVRYSTIDKGNKK